jgi:hypothetical protein
MANYYLNIVTFLLTTLFYYLTIKPNYTYEISINPTKQKEYKSSSYIYLAIYLLLVIVIQIMVNSYIISSRCGGNMSENMENVSVLTFLPWTLIFGVIIVILTMYPGFKSVFSDVIGYFWVSKSANKVIKELLLDPITITKNNLDTTSTPQQNEVIMNSNDTTFSPEQNEVIMKSNDTIIKIYENTSILINQIVPSNFKSYWNILTPLLKPKYQTENPDTEKLRNKLFEIAVTRDSIGEAMWYIYTGLLSTSIVQLKMTKRECISNPKTMEENYKNLKDDHQKDKEVKDLVTNTTTP